MDERLDGVWCLYFTDHWDVPVAVYATKAEADSALAVKREGISHFLSLHYGVEFWPFGDWDDR
jgi:hypothetical protein